jgi:hypothetical protein
MSHDSDLLNMSTSSYSESFRFPKLNGSNYPTWSVHIQSALCSRMLWLIVNETDTKSPKPKEATMGASEFRTARREWIEWIKKDEAVMGSILAACEDLQHAFILHCESSALMWAALKKVHIKNQTKVNILRNCSRANTLTVHQCLITSQLCSTSNVTLLRPART